MRIKARFLDKVLRKNNIERNLSRESFDQTDREIDKRRARSSEASMSTSDFPFWRRFGDEEIANLVRNETMSREECRYDCEVSCGLNKQDLKTPS